MSSETDRLFLIAGPSIFPEAADGILFNSHSKDVASQALSLNELRFCFDREKSQNNDFKNAKRLSVVPCPSSPVPSNYFGAIRSR